MVFAGYGITAPEYDYDDYAGLDVKDKIVLILRHEPQEFDEKSVFAGKVYTEHAQFASKASNAKMHGARGVILINDRANHTGEAGQLENFANTVGPADAGIPLRAGQGGGGRALVRPPRARTWRTSRREIDKDLKPRSFAFPATLRDRGPARPGARREDRPQRGRATCRDGPTSTS